MGHRCDTIFQALANHGAQVWHNLSGLGKLWGTGVTQLFRPWQTMWHNCSGCSKPWGTGVTQWVHRSLCFVPHGLLHPKQLRHTCAPWFAKAWTIVTPAPHGLPRPKRLCVVCQSLQDCVACVPNGLSRPERLCRACAPWFAKAWVIVLHLCPMSDCVTLVSHSLPRPEWLCHTCAP